MKKIIFLLLVIGLGFLGWNYHNNHQQGMLREALSPQYLANIWHKNSSDTLLEAQPDKLYMQESIGSQGVGITSKEQLQPNFVLRFEVMSLTPKTTLLIKAFEKYDDDVYTFAIQTPDAEKAPAIVKGEDVLMVVDNNIFEPKIFYEIEVSVYNNTLRLRINGKKVAEVFDRTPLSEGQLAINIIGSINNPAGIYIRNVELFE